MRIPGLSGSTQDGAYFGSSGSDAFSGGSSTGATLDYIQEAIDWIGVFDPTGIADFTNGTLFTIRGDYKNAAISYAGVLPGGDLLKAGRLGAKMAARASLIAMPILVKEGKKVYNAIQAGRRAAKGVSKYLYHYTSKEAAQSISQQGLKVGRDGFSYLTNKGSLSPLQAQIELALPANRALPNSILRIDASGLSPSLIRRVSGNLPGYGAGGGTEFCSINIFQVILLKL